MNSSSNATAPVATVASKVTLSNPGDTCSWYANAACNIPRTCFDCINVKIQKDECAVAPNGMCVSMDLYNEYAPKQKGASAQLGSKGFFPAANYTYCALSDAACATCRSAWREEYWHTNQPPVPAMCQGTDGCFCLSNCELPNRVETIVMSSCGLYAFDQEKLMRSAYIGVGVFALMVVGFLVFKSWATKRRMRDIERADEQRRALREHRLQQQRERSMRTGPALALGGWNSLRDKLLASEREGLERGSSQPTTLAGVGVIADSNMAAPVPAPVLAPATATSSSESDRTREL